jgi:hypothetical protein
MLSSQLSSLNERTQETSPGKDSKKIISTTGSAEKIRADARKPAFAVTLPYPVSHAALLIFHPPTGFFMRSILFPIPK